ncbi:MAG TPA: hypothetical protein PLP49_11980, partial [Anaerohalosphaeraceae bacterium]|nr:hypothetical protein [Anaerohalosphaeraceae bacterium]
MSDIADVKDKKWNILSGGRTMKKIMVCLLCFVIADGAMAALPFGVNLLMNPSFEDFSDSVEPWKNDGCL